MSVSRIKSDSSDIVKREPSLTRKKTFTKKSASERNFYLDLLKQV